MPIPFAAPFRSLTVNEVKNIIAAALMEMQLRVNAFPLNMIPGAVEAPVVQPHLIARAFVNGDHWQGGSAWIGPRPDPTMNDSQLYNLSMMEIARQFVSQNAIAEVVDRHMNGVVGVIPQWGLTPVRALAEGDEPNAEEQALIDEGEALLTQWWDDRQVHEMLQEYVLTLLLSERAAARVFVPRGKVRRRPVQGATPAPGEAVPTEPTLEAAGVEEALRVIWVEHPPPERATLATDEDTKERVGITLFERNDALQPLLRVIAEDRAEITFLKGDDARPMTVVRMLDKENATEIELDIGGRLTLFEGRRPLFCTPQMWQQQKALNLALSMSPRTVVTAGFLERTILNAQMPGKWITDSSGEKVWVPDPYFAGPGVTNALTGIVTTDDKGNKTVTTPQIDHRPPVPTEPLFAAATGHYTAILAEAKQMHVLAVQNTQASGKTHEQARADFRTSLLRTKSVVDSLGIWMLGGVLALAEYIGGEPGRFTSKLRPIFSCHLDVGPVTADVRVALNDSVAKGTLSRETAIMESGVVDSDAELTKLAAQEGAGLAVITEQAAAVLQMTQAGSSFAGACEFVGIDPDLVTKLTDFSKDPEPPQPEPVPGDPNNPPTPPPGS